MSPVLVTTIAGIDVDLAKPLMKIQLSFCLFHSRGNFPQAAYGRWGKPLYGYTLHQLKTYQEFPDSFSKKSGKARFERALTLLQRKKRIVKVREKDANRNYKNRFKLGDA